MKTTVKQVEQPINFTWNPPGPVSRAFVADDALLCGIRGPFATGKSVSCIAKLLRNFTLQRPGPDGYVRRRTAIIRNTYPELTTTTIKTWQQWVPPNVGRWREKGPPMHRIITENPKVDWEIWFLALDQPDDLRHLLSMELSDAWINEARELPKVILDGLTGRVGRFPRTIRNAKGQITYGCAAPQIVMDTNPPDTDHWWAKMADFPDPETVARNEEIAQKLRELGVLRPNQALQRFYAQPSGRSPEAENLRNLTPGYYERLSAGKSNEWIKVYVDGEYGFVLDGKPVYPEYRDGMHCREIALNRNLPIYVGIDFGLTPAATIAQRTIMGAWRIYRELVTEDMGALEFGNLLGQTLRGEFVDYKIASITGDPAGDTRAQTDKGTPFEVLRAAGIAARPAATNDPTKRRETFAYFLNKMVDGEPGMLIHPNCQKLRKALAGGYHYKRVQVTGQERYHDLPVKDMFSHVAEAAQYMLLGAGEQRTALRAAPELTQKRTKFADGYDRNPFEVER
jgi:hypothetical protein